VLSLMVLRRAPVRPHEGNSVAASKMNLREEMEERDYNCQTAESDLYMSPLKPFDEPNLG